MARSSRLLPCVLALVLSVARGQNFGSSGCPCISSGAAFGVSGELRPSISGETYNYGSDYGMSTCAAHDSGRAPFCAAADSSENPGWCEDSWCYIDPNQCDQGLPPFQSAYFDDLYYSYQTCGTQNTFDAWFRDSTSTETHDLTELATLATGYVRGIVGTLEDNEAELRDLSSSTTCSYNPTCPCCGCAQQSAWGEAPPLTFQQTLTLPYHNRELPGVDACLGDVVGDAFQRVAASEANQNRIGYEYYASTRGTYMQWPGMEDCGNSYDPRFRDWFAGAAAGPKDVLIVVDTSGSMTGNRMRLAKEAAQRVVNTLTDADYASVIGFSSAAQKEFTTLMRATRARRQEMTNWIDSSLSARGGTNFRAAFEAINQVLTATTTSSGCNRVILFLSDGVPSEWDASDYASTQADLASLGNAHLLTYALGSGADSVILKNLACQNGGILYEVGDNANLGDIMAEYYKLLSPMMEQCSPRWISYLDTYTQTELLGLCIAAYSKQSNSDPNSCSAEAGSGREVASGSDYSHVPELIGVACIDMSLIASESDLRAQSGWSAFEERIQDERSACSTRTLTEGQMELLRRRVSTSAMCDSGTTFPDGATDETTYTATGTARACSDAMGIDGLDAGAIAGIVVGSVLGPLLICCLLCWCCKAKKTKKAPPPAQQNFNTMQQDPAVRPSVAMPMQQPIQVNVNMMAPPQQVMMAPPQQVMMAPPVVMAQPVDPNQYGYR